MLSCFHIISACHGQTDGRTDRIAIDLSISCVSLLTRDKNNTVTVVMMEERTRVAEMRRV